MPEKTANAQESVKAEPKATPGVAALESDRQPVLWIAFALAAVTFGVYFRTLHNGFISYDDYDYITSNPLVRQGLTWHGITQAFTTFDQSNWFPIEWISLMATSQFFGLSPFAYHLANIVLHIANVVLLFVLLQKSTGRTARSAIVGGLFAVLPLNVEAVAWATERKSVLSVFFLLASLLAYGWYARRPSAGRYVTIAIPFALGLMTKAWLVTFPFALLLLDFWPLRRINFGRDEAEAGTRGSMSFAALIVEKIPFILMSLAVTMIGIRAAKAGDAFAISTANSPFSLRFENAVWSYLAYILKGVWPSHLAIIYPFPQHFYAAWKMALATVFLATITLVVWRFRERRYLIVGWLWYLGVLFPVIGLIQTGTQSMADRWAYISFWGLFVAVVWGVADFAAERRLRRIALAVLAPAVLAAYACVSYVQTGYWRDGFALYSHAVAVTKDNGPVRVNLGVEYERMSRPDLALQQYRQAVVDTPNLGVAHFDLAQALDDAHNPMEAAAQYELAIANTNVPHEICDAHIGLGKIYTEMNLPGKAIEEFGAALAANPSDVYALLDRGMIEFRQGDLAGAQKDFTRSVRITPTPMTWFTLGLILEQEKNISAAAQAYEEALRLNPKLAVAQTHLNNLRSQIPR